MKEIDPHLPINETARKVVDKVTNYCNEFSRNSALSSMTPFPTEKFKGLKCHDLTSIKVGRYVIVGCSIYRASGKRNYIRWVAKCSCGRYQILSTKAINKKRENSLMCKDCEINYFLSRSKKETKNE